MQIIRHLKGYEQKLSVVLTIGNFDGLHLGHQTLIREVLTQAKQLKDDKILRAVLSFEPHASVYFERLPKNYRILSLKNKLQILQQLGIDLVVLQKFDQQLAQMKAQEFLSFIVEKFVIKHLVVGYDFTFGNNKEGDISLLKEFAKQQQFSLSVIPAAILKTNGNADLFLSGEGAQVIQKYVSTPVHDKNKDSISIRQEYKEDVVVHSSSYIRKLLAQGRVEGLTAHLGYYYYITGVVIEGRKLARELGYPTANIRLHNLARPKYGVYLVRVGIGEEIYFGMANIGVRPTIDGLNELLEVNIFDYDNDIYGVKIKVELLQFIREEKKFASLEALKAQIQQDKINIQQLLTCL
jgi:riboflavin kinase / FMN adenylyltransferase